MQKGAFIRQGAEVFWENPPGHSAGSFSKMLVRPENADTEYLDFRISSYQPKAHVEPHAHKIQEQIYYVIEGEGLMEIAGQRTIVRPDTVIFIPPGISHAIYNTGLVDLKFLVITSPPDDE
jgi:mannose-6-phosphate isomerase-like protein (cupin superfamily)